MSQEIINSKNINKSTTLHKLIKRPIWLSLDWISDETINAQDFCWSTYLHGMLRCINIPEKKEIVKLFLDQINHHGPNFVKEGELNDIDISTNITVEDKPEKLIATNNVNRSIIKSKDSSNRDIYEMAKQGNMLSVKKILESKIGIDSIDKYHRTPLYYASHKGHKELVQYLLQNGAKVDFPDKLGFTALMASVLAQHYDITAILLDHNANPNTPGLSPLNMACQNGNKIIVDLLINNGAKLDAQNSNDNTLLHSVAIGITNGNDKCWNLIELLITKQVNPFAQNAQGKTPRDILEQKDWSYAEKFDDFLEMLECYASNS